MEAVSGGRLWFLSTRFRGSLDERLARVHRDIRGKDRFAHQSMPELVDGSQINKMNLRHKRKTETGTVSN